MRKKPLRPLLQGLAVALLLRAPAGAVVAVPAVRTGGVPAEGRTRVALDLMDLDVPGEGGGDRLELPPLEEPSKPAPEPAPPSSPKAGGVEGEKGREVPPPRASSPPEPPDLVPLLLPETEEVQAPRPAGGEAAEEIPIELKAVSPVPVDSERLKLPSAGAEGGGGEGGIPEMPLLPDSGGAGGPEPAPPVSVMPLKPLPGLEGKGIRSGGSVHSGKSRRPEDFLRFHEEMDTHLIEIYKRFYERKR